MKIAVTGSTRLAGSLVERFGATPIRVDQVVNYNDYDVFINCAHVGFKQCELLETWFKEWKYDPTKIIINISSRAGLPNLSKGYIYGAQKAALDHLSDNLIYNTDKECRITTLNLGMLEDELPSVSYEEVGHIIDLIISLPTHLEIPRLFLQHSCNYQLVQQMKASRYKD